MDSTPRPAIERIPWAHATALRLAACGASVEAIAESLGIDQAGVPALLHVAQAKLDRARQDEDKTGDRQQEGNQ